MIINFSVSALKNSQAQVIEIIVTEKGYEPNSLNVRAGERIILNFIRKTEATCATQVQIPSKKIKLDLPLNKIITVDLGVLKKGEIRFACGMNMVSGVIFTK